MEISPGDRVADGQVDGRRIVLEMLDLTMQYVPDRAPSLAVCDGALC
jgi:hypothetical protein